MVMMDPWWIDDEIDGFNGTGDSGNDLIVTFVTNPLDGGSIEEELLPHKTEDNVAFRLPSKYVDLHIVGRNAKDTERISKLQAFLHGDTRRWREVVIEWDGRVPLPSTPTFLDILALLMRRSEKLDIIGSLGDEAAYRTLMSGLMAPNGTRQLLLHDIGSLRDERIAKLLANGLAGAKNLESFRFESIETKEVVGGALIEGLRTNESLKFLELETIGYEDEGFLPKLIKTVERHPKIESLSLESHEINHDIMENLGNYLGVDGCRLKELKVVYRGGRLPPLPQLGISKDGKKIQNASLRRLDLVRTLVSSHYLDSLCTSFTALSVLALPFNAIDDLSPLSDALYKGSATIQVLDLRHNQINHEAVTRFATKIPEMKSLRRVCLSGNPCFDGSPATAATLKVLSESIQKSRSLECFLVSPKQNVSFEARHAMNINRGGRRGMSLESTCLPAMELWPLILHRTMTIKYFDATDELDSPHDETPRSDVLFYLLRHNPAIFDSQTG